LSICTVAVAVTVAVAITKFLIGSTFYAHVWQEGERYNEIGFLSIGSTVADSNFLSLCVLPVIPLLFYLKNTSKRKEIYWFLVLIFIIFTIIVFSRTGVLLLGVVLILLSIDKLVTKKSMRVYSAFFALMISVFIIMNLNSENGLLDFFAASNSNDSSISYRSLILILLIMSFWENPLFGIGSGQFKEISLELTSQFGATHGIDTSPMNTYLGTLAELGLIGLIFLIAYLRFFFNLTILGLDKDKTNIFKYMSISVLVIIIYLFMLDAMFLSIVIVLFALIGALSPKIKSYL